MFYLADNEKIGAYLKDLIEKKGYEKDVDFCKAYLNLKNKFNGYGEEELQNTKNRFSQIFKGKKALQTHDLPILTNLLGVSCEEMTSTLAVSTLIALCSIALGKPALPSLAVLGEISISGSLIKAEDLANSLQVCLDSGAKKVLLPITSAAELGTVPPELMGNFSIIFYQSAEDAVFKALGVE